MSKWSTKRRVGNTWTKYVENLITAKEFKNKTYKCDSKLFELTECYQQKHCLVESIKGYEDLIYYYGFLDDSMVYALKRDDGYLYLTTLGWKYLTEQLPGNMQLHELIIVNNKVVVFFARQYDGKCFIEYEYNDAVYTAPFGVLIEPLTKKQTNIIEHTIKELKKGFTYGDDVKDVADNITGVEPWDDKSSVCITSYGKWILKQGIKKIFNDISRITNIFIDDYDHIEVTITANDESYTISNSLFEETAYMFENNTF